MYHTGIENGAGELDAASTKPVQPITVWKCPKRTARSVEGDGSPGRNLTPRIEFGDVPLFAWGVGSDG